MPSSIPESAAEASPPATARPADAPAPFVCNICGAANPGSGEAPLRCWSCRSSVRFRVMAQIVTDMVLGDARPLHAIDTRRPLRGIGLSDFTGYATRLAKLCEYTNTYFHKEPQVDICNPPRARAGTLDFLISSDVFEHVPPPASSAFAGAHALLKPGGLLILSVPVRRNSTQTIEHYPRLHRYSVVEVGADWCVVNQLREGGEETYLHPRFHGGPGQTLEMRIFAEAHVRELLTEAGFDDLRTFDTELPAYGICDLHKVSGIFVARKRG